MILELLTNFINSVLPFLVILTILVFVHELGHYTLARMNNVKVEVFSIGFGKELFGFNDKSGTRWKFSLIPLGGYVKMHGDADEASTKSEDTSKVVKELSFHNKSIGQRSAILFAGPLANYLFSFLLLLIMNFIYGTPSVKPIISEIIPNLSASKSGMEVGDIILSVNNEEILKFSDLSKKIGKYNNQEVVITVNRNNKILDFNLIVENSVIGIKGDERDLTTLGLLESINHSLGQIYYFTVATLKGIFEIFKGERSSDELGGPIRIAELSSDFWDKGMQSTLWFMVIISLNLGLINLFPIPLLDGGHLLFNLIEYVKGSPIDQKALEILQSFGFFALISLMLFATYNDISRFFN
ncbi:MAG: RIP metalloprotease RseP [Rickettsiales bacterium]|jgi:regulator of sigma E protease|nr:RIP metalloprotease RseP [Rickettsiales bacterium]OUW72096.1 MAG: RIP metalloprotease RseP [Rickettsiales bacterium TMED211]